MCGIIGIFSHRPVAHELYDGLIHLQHRGQDAAGILTYNKRFHIHKGAGYVREVFQEEDMKRLEGNWGIGHTRYPTAGSKFSVEDAQPFFFNYPYGVAMAHNGDITNYRELVAELEEKERRHCNSSSDIEVILNVFVERLQSSPPGENLFDDICSAAEAVFARVKGGYSVVGVVASRGLFAFRDPHGIRPLVCGARNNPDGSVDYIFSSENTMYYPLGFELRGNVAAGEVVYIDEDGNMWSRVLRQESFAPCIFEYVYFARPDAMLNNVSVYRARLRMGQNLARKWKEKYPEVIPDIVIPVPVTSNTAALSMAHELGVRYSEGLYKNQFVGRTFIMPEQEKRRRSVLQKLSPQETEIRGKAVMLLDDSIVRGTTSREVVQLVRHAGAKAVYFVSACPPVISPCFYGVDMPTRSGLIAANKSQEEIRQFIGADLLLYQTIDDLVEAVTRRGEHNIKRPCMACLDRWYVTGDISEEKINALAQEKKHDAAEQSISPSSGIKHLTPDAPNNALLIGSGAREHAIARAIKRSMHPTRLFCFGSSANPGIKKLCEGYAAGDVSDTTTIVSYARANDIRWAIIGPENPLEAGVVDALRSIGVPCIGPTRQLAQLETSKSFTRNLLTEFGISGCPKFKYFANLDGVRDFMKNLGGNYVVKADGLMGGKGVKVSGDHLATIDDGAAWCEELIKNGKTLLIEEKLIGQEFSLMSFCDGEHLVHTPATQDHKRAFAGDFGPNTGGMGSYSAADHSLPFLASEDIEQAKRVTEATAAALRQKCGEGYKGILYGGFMATAGGVKLIEYNARFADPETMNILPILESDFVELCQAIIAGNLAPEHARFARKATVCKYAVPHGYPNTPIKQQKIDVSGVEDKERLYYAGVDERPDGLCETGSRAAAVVGVADTIAEAERIAEDEIRRIRGPLFHRDDIGTAELIQKRVEMMKKLRMQT